MLIIVSFPFRMLIGTCPIVLIDRNEQIGQVDPFGLQFSIFGVCMSVFLGEFMIKIDICWMCVLWLDHISFTFIVQDNFKCLYKYQTKQYFYDDLWQVDCYCVFFSLFLLINSVKKERSVSGRTKLNPVTALAIPLVAWMRTLWYTHRYPLTAFSFVLSFALHVLLSSSYAANRLRIFFGVLSSFKCLVVYLSAFKSGSALTAGWSFSSRTQPLTSTWLLRAKAPIGCTWSYSITRPTITRSTSKCVSSRSICDNNLLSNQITTIRLVFIIVNFQFDPSMV